MSVDFDRLVIAPSMRIFGDSVWYRPPGVQPIPIQVVQFMAAHELKGLSGDGVPISDVKPVIGIRLSDLMAAGIDPQQGDKVTIDLSRLGQGMVDFQVSNIDPDGEGGAALTLNQLVVPA
jgi:hypothetical protein